LAQIEIIKILIKEAGIPESLDWTALMHAAQSYNVEAVRILK